MSLVEEQAPPKRNDGPAVWDLVVADVRAIRHQKTMRVGAGASTTLPLVVEDMTQRDAVGRERYGTPLQPFNGRDALVDAYQEGLDKAVYLRQALYEAEARRPRPGYAELRELYEVELDSVLRLRALVELRAASRPVGG